MHAQRRQANTEMRHDIGHPGEVVSQTRTIRVQPDRPQAPGGDALTSNLFTREEGLEEVLVGVPERSGAGLQPASKPTDNAMIEAFNAKLRAECLNESWFLPLEDAREKIEGWLALPQRTSSQRPGEPRPGDLCLDATAGVQRPTKLTLRLVQRMGRTRPRNSRKGGPDLLTA